MRHLLRRHYTEAVPIWEVLQPEEMANRENQSWKIKGVGYVFWLMRLS
jgi:hypothetical protein